tara:strand:- start:2017 stop:4368 length:2352 start_codon:yes stop_codon:yes gene_type:complete
MSEDVQYKMAVSVRELVQFVMLSGSIERGLGFVGPSPALEGVLGHQHLQEGRPEEYKAEVYLKHECHIEEVALTVRGRVDGIWELEDSVLIEEIKTVSGRRPIEEKPVHWAQCKVYAYIYMVQHDLQHIGVQLTYLNRRTYNTTEFQRSFTFAELEVFFDDLVQQYMSWSLIQIRWQQIRDRSIKALHFPYIDYRKGQRSFAVHVYKALADGQLLFAEAPTGIGKTMGVLFPAVKAVEQKKIAKIFYLTAKTIGREVAQKAFADMREAGLRFRVTTLTAKEKICFREEGPCDVETCPFAIGYYDRLKDALFDAMNEEAWTRQTIERLAHKHVVCPFELSLDLSIWGDAIICDYNYAFSPNAQLRRYFEEDDSDIALLVDEAHNLVDRARAMFSASLEKRDVWDVKRMMQKAHPPTSKALHRVNKFFVQMRKQAEEEPQEGRPRGTIVQKDAPKELLTLLEDVLEEAELYLMKEPDEDLAPPLLELYFRIRDMIRAGGQYDKRFVTIFESFRSDAMLRLFCIDPSTLLKKVFARVKSAILFSATLRPIDYFREMLGGGEEDRHVLLPSPFPQEHLHLMIDDRIATTYRMRGRTYGDVARVIAQMAEGRDGNMLVFFPSYRYLEDVVSRFLERAPSIPVIIQRPGMSEEERENFLYAFESGSVESIVGFAVMGGIFGEGIDLVGDRLTGAIVVGVGLPQVCTERDLIREYYDEQNMGFDYAYVYPGMNKVMQAAGRVIRTEEDRGRVLLIDQRFRQERYRKLFPPWWQPVWTRHTGILPPPKGSS